MYVNKADDGVGKLCFFQPNKAFSVFVIRVLAVVFDDLERFYKILHYKRVDASSMKASYFSGQPLHIICKDILYEKME